MKRTELIATVLQELRYLNVSPYSDQWEQVSNQIDIVVRELLMTGDFNNLTVKLIHPEQETDPVVLANFVKYDFVYRLPADFGSLETRRDEFFVGCYNSAYYLCVNHHPVFCLEYQMKPDFEDFAWCDPLMLNIIVKETATRMEAILNGSYANYMMQKNNELIQKARRIKTNRINFRVGRNYPHYNNRFNRYQNGSWIW